jgi:hypothetical protein
MPTFDDNLLAEIKECAALGVGRGGEYEDSWAIENMVRVFTDCVLRITGNDRGDEAVRLLQLASLCDVKLSRLGGAFKMDTWHDGVNYQLVLAALTRNYVRDRQVRQEPAVGSDTSRAEPNRVDPASMPIAWYNKSGVPLEPGCCLGPL